MFSLTIKTDNAAFSDGDKGLEVARILRKIANEVESGVTGKYKTLDVNGNAVGGWWLR